MGDRGWAAASDRPSTPGAEPRRQVVVEIYGFAMLDIGHNLDSIDLRKDLDDCP
jgi:hypothetical protein